MNIHFRLRLFRRIRSLFLGSASLISVGVLALAVARCSPIAPSVPKSFGIGGEPHADSTPSRSASASTDDVSSYEVQTVVSSVDQNVPMAVMIIPAEERSIRLEQLVLDSLNHSQELEDLRTHGQAELDLRGYAPFGSVKAMVKIDLRADALLRQDYSSFSLELRRLGNGRYALVVPDTVDLETSRQIRVLAKRIILSFRSEATPQSSDGQR